MQLNIYNSFNQLYSNISVSQIFCVVPGICKSLYLLDYAVQYMHIGSDSFPERFPLAILEYCYLIGQEWSDAIG